MGLLEDPLRDEEHKKTPAQVLEEWIREAMTIETNSAFGDALHEGWLCPDSGVRGEALRVEMKVEVYALAKYLANYLTRRAHEEERRIYQEQIVAEIRRNAERARHDLAASRGPGGTPPGFTPIGDLKRRVAILERDVRELRDAKG